MGVTPVKIRASLDAALSCNTPTASIVFLVFQARLSAIVQTQDTPLITMSNPAAKLNSW
jgi:hypothetical protein